MIDRIEASKIRSAFAHEYLGENGVCGVSVRPSRKTSETIVEASVLSEYNGGLPETFMGFDVEVKHVPNIYVGIAES